MDQAYLSIEEPASPNQQQLVTWQEIVEKRDYAQRLFLREMPEEIGTWEAFEDWSQKKRKAVLWMLDMLLVSAVAQELPLTKKFLGRLTQCLYESRRRWTDEGHALHLKDCRLRVIKILSELGISHAG